MNAPLSQQSSSATAPQSVPPSSSASPFVSGYTPAYVPAPHEKQNFFSSAEFWVLIIGMIISGVVGYFSSQQALKESIASLQGQVNVLSERVSGIKPASDAVPNLQKDVAVLEAKLQALAKEVSSSK